MGIGLKSLRRRLREAQTVDGVRWERSSLVAILAETLSAISNVRFSANSPFPQLLPIIITPCKPVLFT